jgi:hypothetical protein
LVVLLAVMMVASMAGKLADQRVACWAALKVAWKAAKMAGLWVVGRVGMKEMPAVDSKGIPLAVHWDGGKALLLD